MRTDEKTVVAVDVGTTKICTIVARESKTSGLRVLAHNTIPCKGLIKGNVADIPVTEKAINESIQMAQQAAGIRISSAFVGITGAHIGFENKKEKLKSINRAGVIVADELNNPVTTKTSYPNQRGRKLIHAIRMSFSVDGQSGIKNPVGMHSSQVEAETHLITADTSFINKLVLAVENIGIKVSGLVLEPLASGLAVLSPKEKMEGAVLVDIGGGTTEIAVMSLGGVVYANSMRVAGDAMDAGIIQYMRKQFNLLVGEASAEKIKKEIGTAMATSNNTYLMKGRDIRSGTPKEITLKEEDTAEAFNALRCLLRCGTLRRLACRCRSPARCAQPDRYGAHRALARCRHVDPARGPRSVQSLRGPGQARADLAGDLRHTPRDDRPCGDPPRDHLPPVWRQAADARSGRGAHCGRARHDKGALPDSLLVRLSLHPLGVRRRRGCIFERQTCSSSQSGQRFDHPRRRYHLSSPS